MTTVKAACAECRHVVLLLAEEVTATIYAGMHAWFGFACPLCHAHVCKPADVETLDLLRSAGIKPRIVLPSPRPSIDGRIPDGPPLTEGDVFDLRLDLAVVVNPLAELTS